MKNKEEQTGLIGLAIGAAVIGLVSGQKPINRESIVEELVRLGRQKGDGIEDEIFMIPPVEEARVGENPGLNGEEGHHKIRYHNAYQRHVPDKTHSVTRPVAPCRSPR